MINRLKNRNISHIIRGRAQGFIPDLLVLVHRISAHNCYSSYGLGLPIYFSNYIIQKTTVRIKYNLQKNEKVNPLQLILLLNQNLSSLFLFIIFPYQNNYINRFLIFLKILSIKHSLSTYLHI
jgi:hypothetical protein